MISTARRKLATSKLPSASRNVIRFRLARLHAELSRCMYSEHGFDPLIRPDAGHVCHSLIVVSYCMPGSAHSHAACAISRISSRTRLLLLGCFAPDELAHVGVIDVEDHHLGRAPRLAAGLDRAGARVGAAHE